MPVVGVDIPLTHLLTGNCYFPCSILSSDSLLLHLPLRFPLLNRHPNLRCICRLGSPCIFINPYLGSESGYGLLIIAYTIFFIHSHPFPHSASINSLKSTFSTCGIDCVFFYRFNCVWCTITCKYSVIISSLFLLITIPFGFHYSLLNMFSTMFITSCFIKFMLF